MTKTWLKAAVMVGMAVMVAGCGGKYSDIIALNERFIALMNDFSDAVIAVNDAEAAADVLNRLADDVEEIAPEMRKMSEKYPNLNDPENLPEPLQETREASQEAGQRYAQAFMKLMPYMADKDVKAAQARVAKAMSSMGPAQKH